MAEKEKQQNKYIYFHLVVTSDMSNQLYQMETVWEFFNEHLCKNIKERLVSHDAKADTIHMFLSKNDVDFPKIKMDIVFRFLPAKRKRSSFVERKVLNPSMQSLLDHINGLLPSSATSLNVQLTSPIYPISESDYYSLVISSKNDNRLITIMQPNESYSRKDIEMFDDAKNWLTWQRDFYNFLFEPFEGNLPDFRFKQSNDREIVSIVDPIGRHGKSKFVKYLCESMVNDIAKISFGSAQQLRSSITKIGSRKIYLIDLPRTKGSDDSHTEIFSVFEEVKNGSTTSVLFGSYQVLLMDSPCIVFLTNDYLPVQRMSADRWKIYTYREIESKTVLTDTGDIMTDAELVPLSYEECLKQFEIQEDKKIYDEEMIRSKRLKIRKRIREKESKNSHA